VLSLRDGSALMGAVGFELPLSRVDSVASATGLILNDLANASPYPSVIVVSNMTQVLTRVTVSVTGFRHDNPADVKMLLVGPNGQNVELMSAAGAGSSVTDVNLEFDDEAAASLPQFSRLTTGVYRPTSYEPGVSYSDPAPATPYGASLGAFAGIVPNGAWSLYVMDVVQGDAGRIGGWSLNFITTVPVPGTADLAVSCAAQPPAATIASPMNLVVTAVNSGPSDASGIVLTNSIQGGFYIDAVIPSKGSVTQTGNLITCAVGALTNGETFTLTVAGKPTGSGALTSLAGIAGIEDDSNPLNNFASLTVPVTPPSLSIRLLGENVILSWPNLVSGYVLQWTDSLEPTAVWQDDYNVPIVINDENVVVYSIYDGYYLYFRLVNR